jgi:hypothetical protein
MATQIIMRPVYNRAEMLYLSIEAEIEARNYYKFSDDLLTLFVVEYGADPMTVEIVKQYPFKSYCIFRKKKAGLTVNILEAFKDAFNLTSDYVLYIEDDTLMHKTYFKYLDVILNMPEANKASVISSFNKDDDGDIHELYKGYHYAALCTTIFKKFYLEYVYPFSVSEYYNDMYGYIAELDKKYKDNKLYKYQTFAHVEQAGMINRAVDINHIQEDGYVIMPFVNRSQHVGFYGKNRPGGFIPGNSFDERLKNLKEIIKDVNKLYKASATPEYNDYKVFSPKLEAWDGFLELL